jgi:hypothetical protein
MGADFGRAASWGADMRPAEATAAGGRRFALRNNVLEKRQSNGDCGTLLAEVSPGRRGDQWAAGDCLLEPTGGV